MRISVPMLQNLGLSGIATIGDDIGGFKGSPQPDLLTKWLELSAFNPIDRDHTEKGTADQEPWVHGPAHEAIRKRYIEERYRLLPYIYTSFEEASRDGLPVMRPMFLEYPEQEKLVTEADWKDNEYFFGHDLLVIPAQFPDFVQKYKAILPDGNLWYEYWSGKQFEPGEMFIDPSLEVLPVFVRGGAIVPRQPLVQNTSEKPQGPLELRVYPDRTCQGSLYIDDGNTFNYLKGDYLRVDYSCEGYEDALRVKISPQQGSYRPWFTQIQTVIYGVKKQPASVQINGQPASTGQYNAADQTLTLQFPNMPQGVEIRLSCGTQGAAGNTCFATNQAPLPMRRSSGG
jgi:alpha-glucosidase